MHLAARREQKCSPAGCSCGLTRERRLMHNETVGSTDDKYLEIGIN